MEIGNLLFNQCEGGYPIERDVGFEDQLQRLFLAYDPDYDFCVADRENEIFCVWPYSWCDCDCGFDALNRRWSNDNRHADNCYQTLDDRAIAEWDLMNPETEPPHLIEDFSDGSLLDPLIPPGIVSVSAFSAMSYSPDHVSRYDMRNAFRTKTRKALCDSFSIPWNNGYGCAVHCTCSHDVDYGRWRESHTHDLRCAVARPQFLYKPDSFALTWYKYPLRDAYANQVCDLPRFTAIIDACIASLTTDPGHPVLRLKNVKGAGPSTVN